jgi:hypothetical protein
MPSAPRVVTDLYALDVILLRTLATGRELGARAVASEGLCVAITGHLDAHADGCTPSEI